MIGIEFMEQRIGHSVKKIGPCPILRESGKLFQYKGGHCHREKRSANFFKLSLDGG